MKICSHIGEVKMWIVHSKQTNETSKETSEYSASASGKLMTNISISILSQL